MYLRSGDSGSPYLTRLEQFKKSKGDPLKMIDTHANLNIIRIQPMNKCPKLKLHKTTMIKSHHIVSNALQLYNLLQRLALEDLLTK